MNLPAKEQRRLALLDALGIDVWQQRIEGRESVDESVDLAAGYSETPTRTAAQNVAHQDVAASGDWSALRAAVAGCTRCGLHETRTQTVFGVGSQTADWMIIGEAPGAEEDRRGEPFVGRAGKLLDEILRAVGLARERVFIANILKCRPPNNRDPSVEEAATCRPYLDRQIALLAPKIILAVGRVAAQQLLKTDAAVGRMRGKVHRTGPHEIPTVVTYHPAYLLRSPSQKRKVWQDLCLARRTFEQ